MLYLSPAITAYCCLLALLLGACLQQLSPTARPPAASMAGPPSVAAPTAMPAATPSPPDLIPRPQLPALRGRCRYCGAKAPPAICGPRSAPPSRFCCSSCAMTYRSKCSKPCCWPASCWPAPLRIWRDISSPDRYVLVGVVPSYPLFLPAPRPQGPAPQRRPGRPPSAAACCWWCCSTRKLRRVDAMGGGDLEALFLTGLYLGWLENLLCLLLACLIGIITALAAQSAAVSKPPASSPGGLHRRRRHSHPALWRCVTSAYLSSSEGTPLALPLGELSPLSD